MTAKKTSTAAEEKQTRVPRQPRTSRAHTGEPSKTTLFVANLPFSVDDSSLKQIFNGQKIKEARVAVRRGGRSRGYGFVTFENEGDMLAALSAVDKTTVDNRQISVRVVVGEMGERKTNDVISGASSSKVSRERRPRNTVISTPSEASKTMAFVGNLPFTVDDAALLKIFSGYSPKEAHVSVRPNGRSKGFALVTFENEAEQVRAIAGLNNTTVESRIIHVLPSTKGSRPMRQHKEMAEDSKTMLFVANLPFVVDDSGLLQIFDGFQVKEAHVAVRGNGKSCGYGFVSFGTEEEAHRALGVVDKSLVEGREIAVRPAHVQNSASVVDASPVEAK